VITIPLSSWEQTFGLALEVWEYGLRRKQYLQGLFHVESITLDDPLIKWRGRCEPDGLVHRVIVKGVLEWFTPYTFGRGKHAKKRRFKQGARTPGYLFLDWPALGRRPQEFRAMDLAEELQKRRISASQFVPEYLAGAALEIYGGRGEPLSWDWLERVTYWDRRKRRWAVKDRCTLAWAPGWAPEKTKEG
jgi:hypothetical protein